MRAPFFSSFPAPVALLGVLLVALSPVLLEGATDPPMPASVVALPQESFAPLQEVEAHSWLRRPITALQGLNERLWKRNRRAALALMVAENVACMFIVAHNYSLTPRPQSHQWDGDGRPD